MLKFSFAASLLLVTSAVAHAATNSTVFIPLGNFSSPNAAFTFINDGDLHITGFKALSTDMVSEVKDIGAAITCGVSNISPQILTTSATWPNEAVLAPTSAIQGFDDVLVIAGGFLVPGKTDGGITLLDRKSGKLQNIVKTSARFYHQVAWVDVDNDGLLDIVSAGANKPIIGSTSATLYWFKQPASNPLGQHWQHTKLVDGPDVFFEIDDFDGDGQLDLLAPQFFSEKLVLYRNLTWSNPSAGFKPTIIDSSIGPVFRAITADLNGDGKKEVVVTNHIGSSAGGNVFVYELPLFTKHTIASNLVNVLSALTGNAAPGAPVVVKPSASSVLPSIVVGGDGAGKAYLLTPKDKNFNYELTVFLDAGKKTIGQVSAGDVDGDGKAEVFVPQYEDGLVHVFRFK